MKYTVSALLIVFLSSCSWVEENIWGVPESKLEKTIVENVTNDIFQLNGSYKSEQGVDITSSEISFEVDGLSDTKGRFNSFNIELNGNPKKKNELRLNVTIKSSSVFTENETRDEHLLNEDFFNSETFPIIAFKSKNICVLDSSFIAKGKLSLVGVESEIELPFNYLGSSTDATDETIYIFEGEVEFDRTSHGMKEAPSVGNLVTLHFYTELKKQ
jgi:polyisoprenoid-binding protein YceI